MKTSKKILRSIYDKTTGYCHLCYGKLCFKNYGKRGERGAWQIEHSNPKAKGGTDHGNNRYPACIDCNCQKGIISSRTVRGWNGKTCMPLGPIARKEAKFQNGVCGGALGAVVGGLIAGPVGALIGAVSAGSYAASKNPDRLR